MDDYSRYVWTLFLVTRDEVPVKLLELINLVRNQSYYGHKVKRIRLDQALELHSVEIGKIVKPRGISLQPTGSHAHEQNAKAERMNRTI